MRRVFEDFIRMIFGLGEDEPVPAIAIAAVIFGLTLIIVAFSLVVA